VAAEQVTESAADVPQRLGGAGLMLPRLGLFRVRAYGLAIAIIVVGGVFEWQSSAFLTLGNIETILTSMTSLAIISFAEMIVIIQGELDLSVGSVYLLSANALGVFWAGGGKVPFQVTFLVAVLFALLLAAAAGAVNAFFTTIVGIPSFIATLGMLNLAQGVALLLTGAANFSPAYNTPPLPRNEVSWFEMIGARYAIFHVPMEILWLVVFFALFWVVRHRTLFGFRSLAIGGNRDASKVARLPIVKYKFVAFILCAVMAGIAGIIDFSYIGSAGPTSGTSLTFPVFAAVVIGGTSLSGGRGTVVGTLLGALLLEILTNGLSLLGVGSFAQLVFVGGVTIAAVTLDRLSGILGRADRARTG
jgi:ribose/xylose/arabinose/galactoside ABC-type transport system permease subunit